MTKSKKKRTRFLSGCPKCGGHWTRVSGIYRCQKCGHVLGSQNPSLPGSPNYAYGSSTDLYPGVSNSGTRSRIKGGGGG